MKTCIKCNEVLSIDKFAKDSTKKTGYRAECNRCRSQRRAKNRLTGYEKTETLKINADRDLQLLKDSIQKRITYLQQMLNSIKDI